MDDQLLGVLRSDHLPDIVEALIGELGGRGLSPRLVRLAESLLPISERHWRSLVVDLATGTAKARQLGKAHPGWLYTARMAEQATHPLIAQHHAQRLGAGDNVLEICTGAGHDTLALAHVSRHVSSMEADAVVAAITTVNLERTAIRNVTIHARPWHEDHLPDPVPQAVWADPARRDHGGSRSRTLADHLPPPTAILEWSARQARAPRVGIKLGPADDVRSVLDDTTAREYIGFGRECRELVLWRGLELPAVSVTLVDQQAEWHPRAQVAYFTEPEDVRYVIEPHPAVIASGEVDAFFADVGVQPIDPQIAYGVTATQPAESPLYQRFQIHVLDRGVSHKRIRRRLSELRWGARTEFKKRGWPGDPESLRSLIEDPAYAEAGVVIIARTDEGHVTLYATRVE